MATGLGRLHFMVGKWDIQAHQMGENGEWVTSPLPRHTTIETCFDGAFLQEQEVQMLVEGTTVRFFIMWSYDKYRDVYRMVACDDQDGLLDVLEGNYTEGTDTIVVSNINTTTSVQDVEGNPIRLQLASTKTHNNEFIDVMSQSFDNGESWIPVYRAVHTRQQ